MGACNAPISHWFGQWQLGVCSTYPESSCPVQAVKAGCPFLTPRPGHPLHTLWAGQPLGTARTHRALGNTGTSLLYTLPVSNTCNTYYTHCLYQTLVTLIIHTACVKHL